MNNPSHITHIFLPHIRPLKMQPYSLVPCPCHYSYHLPVLLMVYSNLCWLCPQSEKLPSASPVPTETLPRYSINSTVVVYSDVLVYNMSGCQGRHSNQVNVSIAIQ